MKFVSGAVKGSWKQSGNVNILGTVSLSLLSKMFLRGSVINAENDITTPTSTMRQIAAHSDQITEHVRIPVAHYQEDAAV